MDTSHTRRLAAIHTPRPPEEGEPSKESSKPNFDRFMFKSSSNPRNLQVPTESISSTSNAISSSNIRGSKQKRLVLDLSASDVGKISRCVCCNVQWTARKSGTQKMTHIQSCAKKHALDVGTVNFLIQKEISPEEPFINKTFLEDVLVGATPKQKVKRRKKGESLLKTVSTSRNSILSRAQDILSTSIDDYQSGSTFTGSSQDQSELPSTQAFGHSGLAQMQNFKSNINDRYLDVSGDGDGSEAQPVILTSRLASGSLNVSGNYDSNHKDAQSAGHSFGDESGVETNYTLYV